MTPASDSPTQQPIRRALIVYNPASGRRKKHRLHEIEKARAILREMGVATELAATQYAGGGADVGRQAIGATDAVIVCGGDGTINEVANGLAMSGMPLAVLPAGTANVLAKELGIPWNIAEAARLIPGARHRRIALGAIDYLKPQSGEPALRYFVCLAGAGPDGALVRCVGGAVKDKTGQLAYWLEGFRQLVAYKFPAFRVAGVVNEREARLLVIGRTKNYGGPFCITTEASLYEDSFELMATNSTNPLQYLAWLAPLYFQRLRRDPRVTFWKAKEFTCESKNGSAVYAQADGEPIGALPLRFRIVPDALTLCVPAASDKA